MRKKEISYYKRKAQNLEHAKRTEAIYEKQPRSSTQTLTQLKNLSGQVLEYGGQVDRSTATDTVAVVALSQDTMDSADLVSTKIESTRLIDHVESTPTGQTPEEHRHSSNWLISPRLSNLLGTAGRHATNATLPCPSLYRLYRDRTF